MRYIPASRLTCTLGLAAPLLLLVSQTGNLNPLLATHETKLQNAKSLTAKFTVQRLPGGPVEYTLAYSKPNLLKIESPEGFTLSDGKTIWVYDKAKNTYTENAVDEKNFLSAASTDDVLAWGSFFDKDALKDAKNAKVGSKRNIKGNLVTEVSFSPEDGKTTLTLYIDSKLGIARGIGIKRGDAETLVLATELSVSDAGLDASKFAFTAPAGSTKYEAPTADNVTYAMVAPIFNSRCVSCHNSVQRAGALDLSSLASIKSAGRAAVSGNSKMSSIVRSMRSGRMPQGGARVPDDQIDLIAKWIDGGMKE